jgi:hypothetical protein
MSTPTYTLDFTTQPPAPAGFASRALRRTWGVMCGATFVATRVSIYLLVLPLAALASLSGIALYAVQALVRSPRV